MTLKLFILAGHHFLNDARDPIAGLKIVDRIKQASEELQTVGSIDHYEFSEKKQGAASPLFDCNQKSSVLKNAPIRSFRELNEPVNWISELIEKSNDDLPQYNIRIRR